MTLYYTYLSYEYRGRGYIGYRKCPKNKTPETDRYLGSFRCKDFKPDGKLVLNVYNTKEEAIEEEIRLHNFFEVGINPLFANIAKQTSTGFSFTGKGKNNPMYGKKGIESPNYGKKPSEETRKKISKATKGKNNPMYGKKGELSPNYGKKYSESRCKNISKAKQVSVYHTPWGSYASCRKAVKHTDCDCKDETTILRRCKNPNKYVKPNGNLPEKYWNKTWKQNGFWYEDLGENSEKFCEKLRKSQQKGTYFTPWGAFISSNLAANHPDSDSGSKGILNRCKNPDKLVKPNGKIPKKYWGRTWRSNGFYYEEFLQNS